MIRYEQRSQFSKVFAVCIFWLAAPFYIWNISILVLLPIVFLAYKIAVNQEQMFDWDLKRNYAFALYLLLFVGLYAYSGFLHGLFPSRYFVILFVLALSYHALMEKYRDEIFGYFLDFMTVLFTLGIVEYLLILGGIMPSLGWIRLESKEQAIDGLGTFYVYLFNLKPGYFAEIFRFQSVFDEAGVVGTIAAFMLLYLDPVKRTYKYILFLLAGILSFSLAFFVLFGAGLLLVQRKVLVNKFVIPALVVFMLVFWNVFEYFILPRFQALDAIDNRSSSYFDQIFKEFLRTDQIWLGRGVDYSISLGEDVSSWKAIAMDYGFVGLSGILLVNGLLILDRQRYTLRALMLVVIFCLSFYQRPNLHYLPVLMPLTVRNSRSDFPDELQ